MADWEDLGRRVLERFCEGDSEIDMLDVQEWGEAAGVLIPKPGGFDPENDIDVTGASERGDPFYLVAPTNESKEQSE